jgi:Na+-transporting methylmalonyl-CoA/oxaloacetate decarboxylase beta subunit
MSLVPLLKPKVIKVITIQKKKINPIIRAAVVSAVPMAVCVAQTLGKQEVFYNNLLMHVMGPNIAYAFGSATVTGKLNTSLK